MLKGKAKRDYQREYMRKRRSNKKQGSNTVGLTPAQIYEEKLAKQKQMIADRKI